MTTDTFWDSTIWNNVSTSETPTGSFNSTDWTLNSTEPATADTPPPVPPAPNHNGIAPVIGYPGPLFTAIHVTALTSLSISNVVVIILVIYLCGVSGSVKEQKKAIPPATGNKAALSRPGEEYASGKAGKRRKKTKLSFWKWNVGERFVIYLAVCDFLEGTSNILDHAYIFYAKDSPPDTLCAIFAFFILNFALAQWMVIVTTAVSACSLIVFGHKMSLGRYDWKLIAFAFGLPTTFSVVLECLGLLGASGAWCYIKYGAPNYLVYTKFLAIFQISLFGLVGLAYGAIWVKIQRTTQLMKSSTTEKYQSSAKVMMIFVAVFMLQYWSDTLYEIWSIFAVPPAPLVIIELIFINLGGVYNSIAYTFIRRRLQNKNREKAVTRHDNIITATTKASGQSVVRAPYPLPDPS